MNCQITAALLCFELCDQTVEISCWIQIKVVDIPLKAFHASACFSKLVGKWFPKLPPSLIGSFTIRPKVNLNALILGNVECYSGNKASFIIFSSNFG